MQAEVIDNILDCFGNSFECPYTGSVYQWLNENIAFPEGSPNPGKFNIGICPWLKEVYEAIVNPEIEIIILQAASQTYKTGVTETIIPYWIVNDPAKILRIHHTKDAANVFTKTRLMPLMRSSQKVNALLGQQKVKASVDVIVLDSMDITISGPSENFKHGFSVQRITIDEAHLIQEPGFFEKLFRRADQYKGRRKIIISTTPGEEIYRDGKLIGDELALLVHSGRIFRRSWKCPNCNKYQVWRWSHKREDGTYSGINWGDSVLDADKAVDIEKTSDNAKLECHFCRHQIEDTKQARINLEQTAIYTCIKENGDKTIKTFEWPAWVAPHNSFKEACKSWYKAKQAADSHVMLPLKEFIQQVAGECWDSKAQKVKSKLTYINYSSESDWADEKYRFMSIDYQGDGRRYYMIVAFDGVGNARLINYGCVHSWIEIEQLAIRYKVQKPNGENAHFVGCDCGYDWKSVAQESVRHGVDMEFQEGGYRWKERFGWLCLRGSGKEFFDWKSDGIKRIVSEQEWYDSGQDCPPARLYYWSNKSIKNLVAAIRDGHNKLTLAVNTQDETLQRQLYSEYPDATGEWKEKSNENHYWDCLCMSYTMATLAGIPFLGESVVVKS